MKYHPLTEEVIDPFLEGYLFEGSKKIIDGRIRQYLKEKAEEIKKRWWSKDCNDIVVDKILDLEQEEKKVYTKKEFKDHIFKVLDESMKLLFKDN